MYGGTKTVKGSETVTSSLIDSYAWDTILKWYEKTAKANNTKIDCNSSKTYGNYVDTPFGTPTNSNGERPDKLSLKNVLYAVHKIQVNPWRWTAYDAYYHYNDDYTFEKGDKDGIRTVCEIATGSSDYTKVNNIYDMAGNMWEWTTEERGYKDVANSSTGTFAVLRGGSFVWSRR